MRAASRLTTTTGRRLAAALGVAVGAGLLSGCGPGAEAERAADGRPLIATTVAPITSIVSAVVGDRARVEGIVPEGTNSHTFEPKPRVAELLATADVVYLNGLQLEEPTRRLAVDNGKDGGVIVALGDRAVPPSQHIYDFSFPRRDGRPNPHLWTDPTLARRYAEIVRDDMAGRDPANADYYAANYRDFAAMIGRFDAALRTAFATLPSRRLLTYHDAYAYVARTYDLDVIGAIQVSDFDDPTPADVARLIDQVKALDVPAIFGSEVFPSPVLAQIGREAGVRYVDELRDDDLPGKPGDEEHSWFGLMRFDFVTITEALGGDATALRSLSWSPPVPDQARYPQ